MAFADAVLFFFSSRRRHTRYWRDWSSDVCSSDLLLRAVALPQDRGLVGAHRQVAVDAVSAGVERAVLEPADRGVAGEAGVLDLGVGLDPVQALAVLAPEGVGVAGGCLIHPEIAGLVHPSRR